MCLSTPLCSYFEEQGLSTFSCSCTCPIECIQYLASRRFLEEFGLPPFGYKTYVKCLLLAPLIISTMLWSSQQQILLSNSLVTHPDTHSLILSPKEEAPRPQSSFLCGCEWETAISKERISFFSPSFPPPKSLPSFLLTTVPTLPPSF